MPRRCALAPLAITHLNVLFPRLPPAPTNPRSLPPLPPSTLLSPRPLRCLVTFLVSPAFLRFCFSFSPPSSTLSSLSPFRHLSLHVSLFLPPPGSLEHREAAMTRVNLPQTPDRYRRTSASLCAPPPLSSPYRRQPPHPRPPNHPIPPHPLRQPARTANSRQPPLPSSSPVPRDPLRPRATLPIPNLLRMLPLLYTLTPTLDP